VFQLLLRLCRDYFRFVTGSLQIFLDDNDESTVVVLFFSTLSTVVTCITLRSVACACQVSLGVATLLTFVHTHVAVTHQSGALTLLSFAMWLTHELKHLPKWPTIISRICHRCIHMRCFSGLWLLRNVVGYLVGSIYLQRTLRRTCQNTPWMCIAWQINVSIII